MRLAEKLYFFSPDEFTTEEKHRIYHEVQSIFYKNLKYHLMNTVNNVLKFFYTLKQNMDESCSNLDLVTTEEPVVENIIVFLKTFTTSMLQQYV